MHCICLWKGPLPTLAFPATSELRLPCSKLTSPLQNGCIWIPRHGELPEYKLASSPHIIMRGPNECKNHRPPENFIYLTLNSYFIVRTDTLQRKSLKIKIPQKGPSENTHSAGEKSPAWSILHTSQYSTDACYFTSFSNWGNCNTEKWKSFGQNKMVTDAEPVWTLIWSELGFSMIISSQNTYSENHLGRQADWPCTGPAQTAHYLFFLHLWLVFTNPLCKTSSASETYTCKCRLRTTYFYTRALLRKWICIFGDSFLDSNTDAA